MSDPPDLDLIQLVQRARMAHDDQARPSEISGAYWLEAKAPPGARPGPTPRSVALRAETGVADVDALWQQLRAATHAGQLGYKVKVATAAHEAAPDRRELRVLIADRADAPEVARVQAKLQALTPDLRWTQLTRTEAPRLRYNAAASGRGYAHGQHLLRGRQICGQRCGAGAGRRPRRAARLRHLRLHAHLRRPSLPPRRPSAATATLGRADSAGVAAAAWTASATIALETLARNGYPGNGADARLRIVVTGGSSPDDITPAGPARLLVLVTPFAAQPAARYREGIKIISDRQERYLPEAKTINYVPAIVALRRARQAGAVEAIYVNRAGHALEGTTTNLFAVFGDRLVTPATEILPGVTRQAVLELAARPHAAGAARPAAGRVAARR